MANIFKMEFCMKRIFDFLLSLLLLIVFLPILLIVSIIVFFSLGSPIFFNQLRPGINESIIKVKKFRTMSENQNISGNLLEDDERLTSVGRALRKLSLDELPQLLNVLKGEMSFVGPRPLLMEYLELYDDRQKKRHDVRPGITGWAQVNGRNAISWEQKFEYDVWYVENQSFWLDIKILFMTVMKVFKSEGISQDGQATMTKFKGSSTSRRS